MFRPILLAAIACVASIPAARASIITMDTRQSSAGVQASGAAYRTLIDGLAAAPASTGYGSTTVALFDNLSNQSVFGGSSTNIAYRYTISFGVTQALAGTWDLRVGVDFGRGGAVFLDGALLETKTNDMWWSGSYGNTTQSFQLTHSIGAGNHTLSIYGLEGCCDGRQQAQFRAPGQSGFTTFGANDGLNLVPMGAAVPVPEPTGLAVLATGLLGLGLARRRRAA